LGQVWNGGPNKEAAVSEVQVRFTPSVR
jgi:hypothetical protein